MSNLPPHTAHLLGLASPPAASLLAERSRAIFRQIVEAYLDTGEPIGSRTLSQRLGLSLSPASIRNVMADLEDAGLIASPHASAGRIPTQVGLRFFVDGILELGALTEDERRSIEGRIGGTGRNVSDLLGEATSMLAGLSHCAGLVVTPTRVSTLRHVEFVPAGPGRVLVVLVAEDGSVENRLIDAPLGLPASALVEATNFLSSRLRGRTLDEVGAIVRSELTARRSELDKLAARLVEAGFAEWAGGDSSARSLIVRGQSRLLEDVTAAEDLERIRKLFDDLERKEDVIQLLDLSRSADGVSIFIGSESKLFSLSGSSVIVSPYRDAKDRIVGAIGVIGPTRLNYARIIPMVDYTARVVGRLMGAPAS
jgi:heat-inducible transcriptional repressor